MPFDFDAETAVTPLGDGRYSAGLDRSWWVQRGPNGGYLAAIVLRALTETVADPGADAAVAHGPLRLTPRRRRARGRDDDRA